MDGAALGDEAQGIHRRSPTHGEAYGHGRVPETRADDDLARGRATARPRRLGDGPPAVARGEREGMWQDLKRDVVGGSDAVLRAGRTHLGLKVQQRAERRQDLRCAQRPRLEQELVHRTDEPACRLGGPQEHVSGREVVHQRLLDEHVMTGSECVQRQGRMRRQRRAQVHDARTHDDERVPEVGEDRRTRMTVRQCSGAGAVGVHHRNDFGVGMRRRLGVPPPHQARSDDD